MVFIVVFASDYDDDVVVVVVDLDVGDLNVENLVVIWYSGLERQSASRQTARQTLNNSMCAFLTINVRKSKNFQFCFPLFYLTIHLAWEQRGSFIWQRVH